MYDSSQMRRTVSHSEIVVDSSELDREDENRPLNALADIMDVNEAAQENQDYESQQQQAKSAVSCSEKGISESDYNLIRLAPPSNEKGAFAGLLELASGGQIADNMNIHLLAASLKVGMRLSDLQSDTKNEDSEASYEMK